MDWKSICTFMKYAKISDEKAYQDFLKEILLENCLGWDSDDIEEQRSITLGSTQRLIPDLIVSKDDKVQFIIEVKQPFHSRKHEDIEQLTSYMKQLEVNIGIFVGGTIEVYYKKIGEGSEPQLLLSTSFKSEEPNGEKFANLFSASSFSVENIERLYQKYIQEKKVNEEVNEIIEWLNEPVAIECVRQLLTEYLESNKKSGTAIEKALNSVLISIQSANKCDKTKPDANEKVITSHTLHIDYKKLDSTTSPTKLRIAGKVKDIAFNLVREILHINSNKTFSQLYDIFGKANYIKAIKDIDNPKRWFMDEVFTSSDGTKFVISNQWGLNGGSKPKFDYLVEIAKSFEIEVIIPYTK